MVHPINWSGGRFIEERIFKAQHFQRQKSNTKMSLLNYASNKFFDDDDYALSAVPRARMA